MDAADVVLRFGDWSNHLFHGVPDLCACPSRRALGWHRKRTVQVSREEAASRTTYSCDVPDRPPGHASFNALKASTLAGKCQVSGWFLMYFAMIAVI